LRYCYNNRIVINISRIIDSNLATIYTKRIIIQLKNLLFIKQLIEQFDFFNLKFYDNIIFFFLSEYNMFFFLSDYNMFFALTKTQIYEILLLINLF